MKRSNPSTELPNAKKPKLTKFSDSSDDESSVEENINDNVEQDNKNNNSDQEDQTENKTDQVNESSGITWDDFTGYSANQIFEYYSYEKLEKFYEEQTEIYPWMTQTREQTAPVQLAHHLCNCKKKFALKLKKGRRVTRNIPIDTLKKFCEENNMKPKEDTKEAIEFAAIDYCLRQEDLFFEELSNLQ